jgi:capsule polysaccharide modification protein KpsS
MHTIDEDEAGLHWKEHDCAYRFRFDSRGYAGWSELAKRSLKELPFSSFEQTEANAYFDKKYFRAMSGKQDSKFQQRFFWDLPPEIKNYIFIPLQLPEDTVQRHAYIYIYEMLEKVARFGKDNGIPVVVKRHPQCKSQKMANLLARLKQDNFCFESHSSIHILIRRSASICTINSTVGAEALAYYKPIYTFGHCDYHHATHVIKNFNDFESLYANNRQALDQNTHAKYIYFYDNEKMVDLNDGPKKSINIILSNWISKLK